MHWVLAGLVVLGAAVSFDGSAFASGGFSETSRVIRAVTDVTVFKRYLASLWPLAEARGVTRDTFTTAMSGLSPDPAVLELTRKQSEFVKPIWSYLDAAVSNARIEQGVRMAALHASTLADVEQRFGVDRSVIIGVWGMETNYGGFTGGKDIVRSLATLAAANYRGGYFRDQLIAALLILQENHVARADFKGSWAGAMGQTQFMPSSFRAFAVDFDGDGRKNIWTNIPDSLASTANYLKQNGWQPGLPWGFEVVLSEGLDFRVHDLDFADWARLGIRRADGRPMPAKGKASLHFPAGAHGPAFLVTANFDVIKRYNASDAYALAVALLGDRSMGGASVKAAWPMGEPMLDHKGRIELQRSLARLGYDVGAPDGRIGARTREALRDFQRRRGLIPDGYPNPRLLAALREKRSE